MVGIDGGAVELVAGTVEVAHADLAEVPRMVVIVEHTVVVHASDVIAASGVLSVLPDAGHHRRCRRRHCPSNSIPPFFLFLFFFHRRRLEVTDRCRVSSLFRSSFFFSLKGSVMHI